jgi:hypothetical protein
MVGQAYGGAEEWTTGFYVGHEDADAGVPTQADADFIKARWQTLFVHGNFGVSNTHTTTHIKVSEINPDGSTVLANTVFATYTSPIAGGDASNKAIPQVALVCTLKSSIPRGLGSKGRMYLPGICKFVQANGKISNTDINNISGLVQTFFNGVNTDLGIRGKVILASKGSAAGAGFNKNVNAIRIGDVYDTQRRRRNGLTESYVSQTIT